MNKLTLPNHLSNYKLAYKWEVVPPQSHQNKARSRDHLPRNSALIESPPKLIPLLEIKPWSTNTSRASMRIRMGSSVMNKSKNYFSRSPRRMKLEVKDYMRCIVPLGSNSMSNKILNNYSIAFTRPCDIKW